MKGPRQKVWLWRETVMGLDALAIKTANARHVRLEMWPLVYDSGEQTIEGQSDLSVGWLLTELGGPIPLARLATICKLTSDEIEAAVYDLIDARLAVRSDQGAIGLRGWTSAQETPEATRQRRSREGRAVTTMSHSVTNKTVTPSSFLSPPLSNSVGEQKTDRIEEVMVLWHTLRVDLGILKRAGARARSANEGEQKGIGKVGADNVMVGLRRMAESVQRDSEREGIAPRETSSAKWFTVEHLCRPANLQRYLDQPDLDERKPQRPRKPTQQPAGKHFKPEFNGGDDGHG